MLNAEAIVGSYLREQPDIKSLEARVLGKTPDTTEKPWVRVTLLDPANVTGTRKVEWLVAYYLQLDCYAGATGGQTEAFKLAKAVRAALVALPGSDLDDGVATDAEFLSMPRIPDTDFSPARERYVLDAEVYLHPKP
jgi:uncharacterized protein DUF3168